MPSGDVPPSTDTGAPSEPLRDAMRTTVRGLVPLVADAIGAIAVEGTFEDLHYTESPSEDVPAVKDTALWYVERFFRTDAWHGFTPQLMAATVVCLACKVVSDVAGHYSLHTFLRVARLDPWQDFNVWRAVSLERSLLRALGWRLVLRQPQHDVPF